MTEPTMDELLDNLGITDDWRVENIKETAMNRLSVKKSKRAFVKKVLDEAFKLLGQEMIRRENA